MDSLRFRKGRRALVATLLAAALGAPVAAAIVNGRLRADRNDAAVRQLIQQELAWNTAYDNHNGRFFETILAEDFLFTDEQGNVIGKPGYIAFVVNLNRTSVGTLSQMNIRVYGDTAVVVARWTGTETVDGADTGGTFRYTDVWVRRGGRWFAISSQDTRIPD